MPNTTFGQLKINLLNLSGNLYNPNDAVKLQLAGNCLNRALGIIQGEIKGHPYTLDTGNIVTSIIVTPYGTPLVDTDIIELVDVSQRIDPRKMTWIPYQTYKQYMADPSRFSGTPSFFWTALQSLNLSGQNIWTLYFVPTPSSAITIYYDYVKNLQFSSDDTFSNAQFSPLPNTFDGWIMDEAKPFVYEIVDSKNFALINSARAQALESRNRYKTMIMSNADGYTQVASVRDNLSLVSKRVATTVAP